MSSTLEPHIYALRKFISHQGDDTYLKMFVLWKRKQEGLGINTEEFVDKVKQYKVEKADDDCDGCKI